jgi:lactate dehydrogenase-like 2-hydroxyacid dehydrogenase
MHGAVKESKQIGVEMADVLFRVPATPAMRDALGGDFRVHETAPDEAPAAIAARLGDGFRVMVTNGMTGAPRAMIEAFPQLALICCVGTGYEGVDVEAAREHKVMVTHGAGANAAAVADHAMALLLAAMRDLPRLDRSTRDGRWREGVGLRPIPTGKRIGLVGLGAIGERIARRAAGFEMTIAYHARRPRPEAPWPHVPGVAELADRSDVLMVAIPGGAATRHMVDAEVLRRLGPDGFLVNVGRGSVVDEVALAAALRDGTIAGAALDVYPGEPAIPPCLLDAPRLVLTPHCAAWAPEVRAAGAALARRNIDAVLAGLPPPTPIPELRGMIGVS